eukprot:SAG31_NODE_55_length_29938_cov_9.154027_5_plen_61_part_00
MHNVVAEQGRNEAGRIVSLRMAIFIALWFLIISCDRNFRDNTFVAAMSSVATAGGADRRE